VALPEEDWGMQTLMRCVAVGLSLMLAGRSDISSASVVRRSGKVASKDRPFESLSLRETRKPASRS
jgi:hypothetical protein